MTLASTKDLAKKYDLFAKRSLGQNFLFDHKITDKIANSADITENDNILEIGPGPAGLTRSILNQSPKKLITIEQDQRVMPILEEIKQYYPDKLEILNADALETPIKNLFNGEKFKIIANLPYNIGTELVFRWLDDINLIDSMTILLQKEVVQRIVAKSGSKKYGRLSVMINFQCFTKTLFDIAAGSFVPAPKVTSSLVQITPREHIIADIDLKILSKLCACAFNQRRKMLRSSLKSFANDVESLLKACNIDSSLRAEQLELEDFAKLVQNYKS